MTSSGRPRSLSGGGPAPALWAALACAGTLAASGALALLVPVVHAADTRTLQGFVDLNGPLVTRVANVAGHSVDAVPLAVAVLFLVAVALARGQLRLALVVALAVPLSVVSCDLLKPLLSGIRHTQEFGPAGWVGKASWPSGHAAGAMCLVLCAVLVAPRRLRPLVAAAGSIFAVAVSFSILVLGWHMPTDVVSGFLMAALWVALGIAVVRARAPAGRERASSTPVRRPAPAGFRVGSLAPAVLGAAAICLVVLARPIPAASFANEHRPFVLGALVIAVTAWSLSSGLALVLRR